MKGEDSLQAACHKYMRLQYPGILSFSVPNGSSRHIMEARKLKLTGVTPGIPDYLIIAQRKGFSGIAIEFKFGKNKATLRQVDMLRVFSRNGFSVHIIYEFDDFKQIVDNYLLLSRRAKI